MLLNHQILGQGPALIILHGLFGSLDNWMTIGRQLSQHYTVYLVDLRNHGSSFHDDTFDYPVMALDIKTLVDELGVTDFSIVGHSMGGKVAMFFAAEFQQLLHKLIVVDIAPRYYPVHHQKILEGLSSIDPASCSSRGEADRQLSGFVAEAGIRQFLLKNLKRNSNGHFEWKINLPVIRRQIDKIGEALNESQVVEVPSLFISGGSSAYITGDDHQRIHRQFPNSSIKSIANTGHWVHAEAPLEFLKLVNGFLQD